MAWLYKRGSRWWIGWREGGIQKLEPTGETDRAKAEEHLRKLELIRTAKASGALTAEMIAAVSGNKRIASTVAEYFDAWLAEAKANTKPVTMVKYNQVRREFIESVGSKLKLSDVTPDNVKKFLLSKRERCSSSTVAAFRRILNSVFTQAQNEGKISGNPVALAKIKGAKKSAVARKRPFTMAEIRDLYAKANPFWQYMLVAGYFTGQSLGDLITLKPRHVDIAQNQLAINRRKTGTRVIIPLAPALREIFQARWPKRADDYFWPQEAKRYEATGASAFSQEFYELMASVGLVPERGAKSEGQGKGRASKRDSFGLGFHNMRHTFVTKLKEVGAVDSVARELAGHGSNAMSTHYTHLPKETLADAINKLPPLLK